jgi:hypothetical protein
MNSLTNSHFFEPMSKRRRGFPSETHVKRGVRVVSGDKLLEEKLGRNDLCPCGSGKRFKKCCLKKGCFRWREPGPILLGTGFEARSVQVNRAGFFYNERRHCSREIRNV